MRTVVKEKCKGYKWNEVQDKAVVKVMICNLSPISFWENIALSNEVSEEGSYHDYEE
mgnify:CR=1 FL=1